MSDPFTIAAAGAAAGAMLDRDKPLRGAALGAMGGYGGATMAGVGGASSGATLSAGAGAMSPSLTGAQATFGTMGGSGAAVGPMSAAIPSMATPAGYFGAMGSGATANSMDLNRLRMARGLLSNDEQQQQSAPAPRLNPGPSQPFSQISPYASRVMPSGALSTASYFGS